MIRILKYGEVPNAEVFSRAQPKMDVTETVSQIINDVKTGGDEALRLYTEKFDRVSLYRIAVTDAEIESAFQSADPELLRVIKEAAESIRAFHSRQVRNSFILNDRPGVVMGQKILPIQRAGVYVPGGTAPLASTVLMDVIPARIAGCPEIYMATPPGPDGKINGAILCAAKEAGVTRVFKMGGAQAIAALAYGTQSVPKVDKIVGPGNAFVEEAKRQVFGHVSIDMIAGPSEILIVADGKTDPVHAAADLLSQAEHDKLSSAVLVTDSMELAVKVQAEVEQQLSRLPRQAIARVSIDENGKIIVAEDLRSAINIANEIAPEHLELCVDNPFDWLDSIKHAGSVFLGRDCPEALGDYLAGPNHTLPTIGSARFSSPLSVDDFVKKTQYTYFSKDALARVAQDVALFARTEGLEGHARSVLARTEENS
ncbi:MAG: histidinol dehydrogenase [Clostridiales bacterium]|nr:histidinol dehydrogenase [Clostridiales bacterium]